MEILKVVLRCNKKRVNPNLPQAAVCAKNITRIAQKKTKNQDKRPMGRLAICAAGILGC
jgi:hypothetical protein